MFGEPRLLFCGLHLGGNPLWLPARGALAFSDSREKRIYLLGRLERFPRVYQLGGAIGCMVPTQDGNLLAAVGDSLAELNLDTGVPTPIWQGRLPDGQPSTGACDCEGRFWLGAAAELSRHRQASGEGALTCVTHAAAIAIPGGGAPSALAFCRDGNFYCADAAGRVDLCQVSQAGATRKHILEIPPECGAPGGICTDADGNLWIALWGGGKVICVHPETGKWLHILALPDQNVSGCCFGGDDWRTLYITTARDQEGLGGRLYAIRANARGVPPFSYRNSPDTQAQTAWQN